MLIGEWIDFLLQLIALGTAVAVPVAALAALRGDARWVTRKEWAMAEERHAQRLAEVVVQPLNDLVRRMEVMAEVQAETLRGQVRQEEINRSINRELSLLREDLSSLKRNRA